MKNRKGQLLILLALILVIGLPIGLRDPGAPVGMADDIVIVITPHTASIRHEFARGFEKWYQARTGRTVYVDYRIVGGTSEITKFLDSEYTNSFRNIWERQLRRPWNLEVQGAFNNARILNDDTPGDDTIPEAARRAWLESTASSGIDVFFGGGAYDLSVQAAKGNLVDCGLLDRHPDWFQEKAEPGTVPRSIPRTLAGEPFYDAEGRWHGTVLSSFGIIYNRKALKHLGIDREPQQWADLADPRYFGQIAVSDPTKSGSMNQAFEMILQQKMHESLKAQVAGRRLETTSQETVIKPATDERAALEEGWLEGMRLIQKISANARYFTDASPKANIDVSIGDCAAGMSIDFYGRFTQENILERSGDDRFFFHTPEGGSTVSVDPIGLLRGAPNRKPGEAFIEFVLSLDGQKLWNFRLDAPGGPETYALRRPPIRPELYAENWNHFRSDADYNPYHAAGSFTYHSEWTGRLFDEIRTIIRIAFLDARKELALAWGAIIEARKEGRLQDAARAEAVLQDLSRISYHEAETTIDAALKAPPIEEMRLSRTLSTHFRKQYIRAREIADGKP